MSGDDCRVAIRDYRVLGIVALPDLGSDVKPSVSFVRKTAHAINRHVLE